ncbi:MAG TPA: retroviral-like aspartic protease family protein [Sphingomicrobium sp.]|nr:retroviral-like aspartic protease family protein [Sphingomicrobium sp.]
MAILALASPAILDAQPATTKLDAVAGIPAQDDKTQTEDIRFKNQPDDRMTVQVRLAGSGPFQFLVDTGADRTAISRDLASKLGLAKGEQAAIHTIAGVSTVSTATITDLELTKKPVTVRDAPVLDSGNMGADGILGVDSLRSQRVLFDFGTKTLSIVPSAVPDFREEPGTIVVQAERKNGRLVVTDATANGRELTVVIDTGAQLSIGNEELRRQLLGPNLVDPYQQVQLESVTGAVISGDYMYVRELQIGGLTLKNLAIVFAQSLAFKELRLDHKPALLLGMNAIRAFKKVSIDFASRKFRVVLPESSQLDVRLAAARLK